ncbi:hypothetical protein EC973_008303 [Apophysomyces ossiformis]|uniref:Eisosome component PIL1-domain-containing protein n=1 Tax=Apophysomyces ossiformis TaxID=679940 RepID=A0A8H7EUC5_9FUNG|nr:hypothetical protein EC973_008303 [Apophysomyces ossiformis]
MSATFESQPVTNNLSAALERNCKHLSWTMFSFNPFHLGSSKYAHLEDKNLNDLLDTEKKVASLWGQMAEERRVSANHMMRYGRPQGHDISVVRRNYEQYQTTMKTIAERESTLFASREKKRRLMENIVKWEENHPGAVDKLMELKSQLAELEKATEMDEVEMSNFKRVATREALYLLLNGMHEMASKTDVIASFGKYIVDELDVTPVKVGQERPEYKGALQTTRIVDDATRALDNWKPDRAKVRRTLTGHHGRNPLISRLRKTAAINKDLPPAPSATDEGKETESQAANSTEVSTGDDTLPTEPELPVDQEIDQIDDEEDKHIPSNHIHKPDEADASQAPQLHSSPYASLFPTPAPSPGGFSHIYLGLPDHQKLYQFYQHYTPPKPYDEMAQLLTPNAVFQPSPLRSPNLKPRVDAGGFFLPNIHPQPSMSTTSMRSHHTSPHDTDVDDQEDSKEPEENKTDTPDKTE